MPLGPAAADVPSLFVLEGAGAWIWERLDGARDAAELAAALAREFDVDPAQAAADLDEFLAALIEQGLAS